MSRIAYVNGRYLPHAQAAVHIEDRGYQFADGVYEVIAVVDGKFVDADGHLARLERSLGEMRIREPVSPRALHAILCEIVRRNYVRTGRVYIQVTRGVAPRGHAFPENIRPSLVVTARSTPALIAPPQAEKGVKVISGQDIRWKRCDIKTVGLTANVLARQAAEEAGAYEIFLVDDRGYVTECSASNAWIVDAEGRLVTRPLDTGILPGITRARIMALAVQEGIEVDERAFTLEEAKEAREAFVTSATGFLMPVVQIDDTPVANGHPGAVARKLRSAYEHYAQRS